MNPTLHRWLLSLDLPKPQFLYLERLLARIDLLTLGWEVLLLVVLGLAGFWLAAHVRRIVGQIVTYIVPHNWVAGTTEAFDTVSAPLFWLAALWLAELIADLAGLELGLVGAVESLLAAWVTIRLLSFAVRNPILSAAISVIAWSLAALSILGLMHPLTVALGGMGVTFGRMRVSVLTVLRGIFLLGLLLWGASLFSSYVERQIARSDSLTPSLQALLVRVMNLVLPIVACLVALEAVGIDLTALTVLSGAIGLGIGLGLQRTVANLVAGLTLIMGKTIKPGDVVAYKDTYGWVTSMGARYVSIATRDGSEFLVPNEELISNGVENWSYSNNLRRLHVPFGVAYESDMHEVVALALKATASVGRILKTPAPVCLMIGFGDSSVNFEVRCWVDDPQNGITNAKSAVLLALWDAFKAAGITLPFPQRDVHVVSLPAGGGGATMPPLSAGVGEP